MKIIYIVFDSVEYIEQAFCSIVSILHFHPEKQKDIILFSNIDTSLLDIPIEKIDITSLPISGNTDDHILIKRINIIQRCMQTYKTDVLCIDSDTLFFKPLGFDTIPQNISYVHMYESPIKSYKGGAFKNIFPITYPTHTYTLGEIDMYNVSVLGISYTNKEALDTIRELTDIIYKATGQRTSDQAAISYILSNTTSIQYLYDKIFHYWAYKQQTLHYILQSLGGTLVYGNAKKYFEEFIHGFAFGCLQFIEKTGDHIIDYYMSKPQEYEKLQEEMSKKL